jgi:hypothetical protein
MLPFLKFQKRNYNFWGSSRLTRALKHSLSSARAILALWSAPANTAGYFQQYKMRDAKFRTNIQSNLFQIFETVTNVIIFRGWVQPLVVRTPSKVFDPIVGPSRFKQFFFHLHLKDVCFGF